MALDVFEHDFIANSCKEFLSSHAMGIPDKHDICTVKQLTPKFFSRLFLRWKGLFLGNLLLVFAVYSCESRSESAHDSQSNDSITTLPQGSLLEQAKQLQDQQNISGAIERYSQVLKADPINIAALGNRAYLRASTGNLEAALQDYNVLLEVDPSNFAGLLRRADLLSKMRRDSAALQDYSLLLSHRPDDAELLNARGEVQMRVGSWKEAIADFDAAFKLRRNWEKPLLNRAAAWYSLGDDKSASADYNRVLQINPQNSEATNGLGLIQQHYLGELEKAEELYQKAILQNPKNAGAWFNLAFLEAGRGQSIKAVADFGEAIRLDSTYVDAYTNRGILQMQLNKSTEAMADFEFSAAAHPQDGRCVMLLGWAQCESNQTMEGCITLARASALGEKSTVDLIKKYCK
jgi:tetratricopeptide (TPR) repeat protein